MKRDDSIDALKGVAIALVVLGHAIQVADAVFRGGAGLVQMGATYWVPLETATDLPLNLVNSFHMPLFAFLSGFVLWPPRECSLQSEVVRRARTLLVPYFSWVLILNAWTRVVIPVSPKGAGPALWDAALGSGGLWYLYVLFICSALIAVASRLPSGRLVLGLSMVGAVLLSRTSIATLPYLHMSSLLWVYPFVVFGYLMAPVRPAIIRHRFAVTGISLTVFVMLFYLLYPISVPSLRPSLDPIARAMNEAGVRGGYLMSLILLYALPYLCAAAAILPLFALYAGRDGRSIKRQAWLGRRSLGVYATHSAILWTLSSLGVQHALVLSVLALLVSVLLVVLLERIPVACPILLGKPYARKPSPSRL